MPFIDANSDIRRLLTERQLAMYSALTFALLAVNCGNFKYCPGSGGSTYKSPPEMAGFFIYLACS